MANASGKIPVLLTATQLDLLGEALMECIPRIADRVAKAATTGTTHEEVLLLQAYLELAKIIIDPDDASHSPGIESGRFRRALKESISPPSVFAAASPSA
jgi:hypothetical protein